MSANQYDYGADGAIAVEQELYGLSQVAYESFKTDDLLSQVLRLFVIQF